MRQTKPIYVIGGGLAGCEAAYQIARMGLRVKLYEMRPKTQTPAHRTEGLAELVCSNSFGSIEGPTASSLLKLELEHLGAFVLKQAKNTAVPAGNSLAVDREKFSSQITSVLTSLKEIEIVREEITEIPDDGICVIATGPLTSPSMSESLAKLVGEKSLYFYDAISPIVSTDSLDLTQMFFASRYQKGEADFLNIPLNETQYFEFVDDLLAAEKLPLHPFEKPNYFESCLPIEVLAERGRLTLAFGPMKPVGLVDPKTGKRPFAIIQLRAENQFRSAYNLVGFQTKLKYPDQKRIFRKFPGMEKAEFERLGSIHRNTFLDSPRLLLPTLQLKKANHVFIAGQLTGTEGYLESSATGYLAGVNAARSQLGLPLLNLPQTTMLGALVSSITDSRKENFQPMNSNFAILPPLEHQERDKRKKRELMMARAMTSLRAMPLEYRSFTCHTV